MEVDSVGIIAILSMSYITTRIVKTLTNVAKIPRVPVEDQITTLSVVKIAIKFSPCKQLSYHPIKIYSTFTLNNLNFLTPILNGKDHNKIFFLIKFRVEDTIMFPLVLYRLQWENPNVQKIRSLINARNDLMKMTSYIATGASISVLHDSRITGTISPIRVYTHELLQN